MIDYKFYKRQSVNCSGFTMMELLIVMAVSGLVLTVLFSLYINATRSYHLQEQFIDQGFNVHFAANRLVEALQEAGADLPTDGSMEIIGWRASANDSSDTLTLLMNKNGALAERLTRAPSSGGDCTVWVANAHQFQGAGNMVIYNLKDSTSVQRPLTGVDTTSANCKVEQCLMGGATSCATTASPADLSVMALDTLVFYRNAANEFIMKDTVENVLSENITRLKIDFLDNTKTVLSSPDWDSIKFAEVTVAAATASNRPGQDGPFIKEYTYPIVLRNR